MKKLFSTLAISVLVVSVGAITGSTAQAVSCNAFNKGTAKAFHVAGAQGEGLYKIAAECHGA